MAGYVAERLDHLSIVADVCREIGLAEHRLRERLTATGHTIPSQVNQPTDRPTMRWMFQCFEGLDLLHIRHGPDPAVALVLRLQHLHQQALAVLSPAYEEVYRSTD